MDKHLNPQDPENMLGYIDALADDLEKAWALGSELPLPSRIMKHVSSARPFHVSAAHA